MGKKKLKVLPIPKKSPKYEAVLQNLHSAKTEKEKRFWTDILLALEKRDSRLKR